MISERDEEVSPGFCTGIIEFFKLALESCRYDETLKSQASGFVLAGDEVEPGQEACLDGVIIRPGEIDPEFWRGVTPQMAAKAKLSNVEQAQLLRYVMAAHSEVGGFDPEH